MDVLVMDFSKNLDKVDHERLLNRLVHYGIKSKRPFLDLNPFWQTKVKE